jgi:hypothetical protein
MRTAEAQAFLPTESEWQAWPGYCRAAHLRTPRGQTSEFINRVSSDDRAELNVWESSGIYAPWHFCWGKTWLERVVTKSAVLKSQYPKGFMLNEAWNEVAFTVRGSDKNSVHFTDIVLVQAAIKYEQHEWKKALDLLLQRIAERPQDDVLYSAAAVLYRKSGDLESAKKILLKGYDAMAGQSAEINYNLGLIFLDLGDLTKAAKYAESAYSQGYPLPGLKRRLDRMRADRQRE